MTREKPPGHRGDRPSERRTGKPCTRTAAARLCVQILALATFVAATVVGVIQAWFLVFALGVLLSLRWGRLYCGWICPMNTLFRPIRYVYGRLGLRRIAPTGGMRRGWIRYGVLVLFVITAITVKQTGAAVPVLPLMTALAVLVTLFIDEMWWHAHLCPFGTILDLTSRPAPRAIVVDKDRCIGCGKCDEVCPTDAIRRVSREDRKRPVRDVVHQKCLTCFRCTRVCPVRAIDWTKRETGQCA